jgi:hypothetical protein
LGVKSAVVTTVLFLLGLSAFAQEVQSPLFPVKQGDKYGYINADGKVVIPLEFRLATEFVDGLAVAAKGKGKLGYINTAGQFVIPRRYSGAREFSEGLAAAAEVAASGFGYIDTAGHTVIPPSYFEANRFSEGLARVMPNSSSTGFIDKTGRWVIPAVYDPPFRINFEDSACGQFHEGLACVGKNGNYGYVDKEGNVAIPLRYGAALDFSEGLAVVQFDDEHGGFIDYSGKVVILIGGLSPGFGEGLAPVAVELNGESGVKWGFIDKSGSWAIRPTFDRARRFHDGLAAVRVGTKWGYIKHDGTFAIKPQFWNVLSFSNGLAKVNVGFGRLAMVNREGVIVWKAKETDPQTYWPD